MNDTILILDYGSQYTQLIARKIREFNVHSIILPFDCSDEKIKKYNLKGIILSGGPSSVYEKNAPKLLKSIFSYNVPILGICYGFQLLVDNYKGIVQGSNKAEYGHANINIKYDSKLFKGINNITTDINCNRRRIRSKLTVRYTVNKTIGTRGICIGSVGDKIIKKTIVCVNNTALIRVGYAR